MISMNGAHQYSSFLAVVLTFGVGQRTGWSQVLGPDFNGDGYADLAIGTPDEGLPNFPDAGIVHVLYGSTQGLTVAGNQIWSAIDLGVVESYGYFGNALAWGDLDGDTFDDLVIGAFGETANGVVYAGAIYVLFGSANGLQAAGSQRWHQDTPGVFGGAEFDDQFGTTLEVGDFNGDGFADIAVGVPFEGIGSAMEAGGVHVIYGSAMGPTAIGNQFWNQNSSGILGACETGDWMGRALAAGDFNNDGFDDLAIGASGESLSDAPGAGAVHVLFGSLQGLHADGNQMWTLRSAGVKGRADVADAFGRSLVAADFDGDGFIDLAIGIPDKDVGPTVLAGAISIIYGGENGLSSAGNQFWNANSTGLNTSAGAGDSFGWKLAAGDFNRDGKSDLAIGIPNKTIGGGERAGAVQMIYGTSGGLSSTGARLLHQNTTGIAGVAEAHDRFGYAVAARDLNGDGYADLAIGAPYEDLGTIHWAGILHILRGAASGVTTSGSKIFTQSTPGMNGETPEAEDEFADYF